MRLLMPILLVGSAIGLFALYTNPTYQATKAVATQTSDYDDALNKSQELKKVRDQLLSKRNTFSSENVQKLEEVLPDNVDNIRLIININNIAARHGLTLKNVELGSVSDGITERNAAAAGSSGSPVGSVEVGFSVSASYENFLAFLVDLEHSLRLVDVQSISFKSELGAADYSLKIRTYWLH